MSTIEIPCPQCGRKLKLPDESFLGRKGRCGKCRHSFILQRPVFAPENRGTGQKSSSASPPLEFAEAPADFHDDEEPLMGVAVRVVPDATPPAEAAETAALLGETSPFMSHNVSAFSEYFADEMHQELAETSDNSADLMHARKLRDREKQKRQRRISAIVAAAIILVAAGVGVYIGSTRGKAKSGETSRKGKTTESRSRAADEETEDAEPEVVGKKSGKPNKPGEPLTLNLIPDGARIVIHLRPAELWSGDDSAEEFRACLGPLGVWLEQTIRERCLMEPASVEEATFALIPKSREAFDVAVVVRSKKELKRSDLITKFDAELVDKPKAHYIGKSLAWYIGDNRTFASAPASMAQSLVESVDNPSATSDGVQALLSMTDRRKHFTLVCDLEDVRLGVKTLAPDNAQKFLESIVDFFGDDVDAICWSLQLGDQSGGNPLQSEVLVRNRLSRTPAKLRGDLEKKLAQLPAEVLGLVKMTNPQKIGEKKVIGRFPIMTKIVEQSTRFDTGHRLVAMKMELPERAGPNLALGTLLTWNQTTLPGFGKSAPAPAVAAAGDLPAKVVDRLKKKITVEFRRDFLYKAIEFISEETGVTFKLDGPGMKDMGVTQNEYQTFSMENVPATRVLYKILVENSRDKVWPDGKLVLIIDEDQKTATITGVNFAKNRNQTPFVFDPPAP